MSVESSDLPPKARRLLAYLRDRVDAEGAFYAKSRYIAEEIELSAKEIGASMRQLQDGCNRVHVEQWGYTNGTTWRISEPE